MGEKFPFRFYCLSIDETLRQQPPKLILLGNDPRTYIRLTPFLTWSPHPACLRETKKCTFPETSRCTPTLQHANQQRSGEWALEVSNQEPLTRNARIPCQITLQKLKLLGNEPAMYSKLTKTTHIWESSLNFSMEGKKISTLRPYFFLLDSVGC